MARAVAGDGFLVRLKDALGLTRPVKSIVINSQIDDVVTVTVQYLTSPEDEGLVELLKEYRLCERVPAPAGPPLKTPGVLMSSIEPLKS